MIRKRNRGEAKVFFRGMHFKVERLEDITEKERTGKISKIEP